MLVNDVPAEPDYVATDETGDVRSELVVPLWVGDELWGVIDVEEVEAGAFDEDDVTLLETVADAGRLRAARRLALRAARARLPGHGGGARRRAGGQGRLHGRPRALDRRAGRGGRPRASGSTTTQLRDLRFAAVFHDIGKIAVPEAILHKPGPLTAEEREVMERHTIVGEQILAPVEFLADVRQLVRHEHERWDGARLPGRAGRRGRSRSARASSSSATPCTR